MDIISGLEILVLVSEMELPYLETVTTMSETKPLLLSSSSSPHDGSACDPEEEGLLVDNNNNIPGLDPRDFHPLPLSTEEAPAETTTPPSEKLAYMVALATFSFLWFLFFLILAVGASWQHEQQLREERFRQQQLQEWASSSALFPSDFIWGAATSSYQVEGAVTEDGRGATIWDTFVRLNGTVLDHSTGDVATDHYHRFREDIAQLMSSSGVGMTTTTNMAENNTNNTNTATIPGLNLTAYRFSVAWSRILPQGTLQVINPAGLAFYHQLIDTLLQHNIQPWITMFHWDLPQALQDQYQGWLTPAHHNYTTVQAFVDYARLLFQQFGHKVKYWITFNEPWTVAVNGYSTGVHAPGWSQRPDTEPYQAAHAMLLAHAHVYRMFQSEFASMQPSAQIGLSLCGDYRYPLHPDRPDDVEAAQRAMVFQFGWFADPVLFGDYPAVMRSRLGSRLPHFSSSEKRLLKGSVDFLGLNYYSSLLASRPKMAPSYAGYWADLLVDFHNDPLWKQNDMGWNVVPDGLREMLLWISHRYQHPVLFVTENGSAEPEPDLISAQNDTARRDYFEGHILACALALRQGVILRGYFAWSLLDNFEWQFGYQRRFGLFRVDFDTLERTPKSSALWYAQTIASNGQNLYPLFLQFNQTQHGRHLTSSTRQRRPLPQKILMGYGSHVDAVRRAVEQGVNVVAWAFVTVKRVNSTCTDTACTQRQGGSLVISTNLDMESVRAFIVELDSLGYDHVVHLASVGGWNGDHLDSSVNASEWYTFFKSQVGWIFDGIDWDLEGNDRLDSPNNLFTLECLTKMGDISRMAKADGYHISIAPPQSYLDVMGSSRFSRLVNLTDPSRHWHEEFPYYGSNVYAYLLHRYGDWIDLVCLQFYESYSRAAEAILGPEEKPAFRYLIDFVEQLIAQQETFEVDFSDDDAIPLGKTSVSLPASKFIIGLANGWALSTNNKALFIKPEDLTVAWKVLEPHQVRGFMFWSIDEEGAHGIQYARSLKQILQSQGDEPTTLG